MQFSLQSLGFMEFLQGSLTKFHGIKYINLIYIYLLLLLYNSSILDMEGCPRGVMVKAMDCGNRVSEFVLQSRYYFHFGQIPLAKV